MSELAHDLRPWTPPNPEPRAAATIPDRQDERGQVSRTTAVLRFIGSALLVTSASTFLLQHWAQGSSVLRYGCLLAHTLLLAVGGYVCGLHVRESHGARSFFGLVLISVPVHFAALGGMLQSALPFDHARGPTDMWPMDNAWLALGVCAVGLVLVAALTHLSATLLVRPIASRYANACLAMNAFLLLPVREPLIIAIMCVVMLGTLLVLDRRITDAAYFSRAEAGRLARALLVLPLVIVMVRTVLWYTPAPWVIGVFALGSGLSVFFWAPRAWPDAAVLQPVAAGVAAFGCMAMLTPVASSPLLAKGLALPLHTLPAAALLGALSFFANTGRATYMRIALSWASAVVIVDACSYFDIAHPTAAAWLALGTGIGAIALGVYASQRLPVMLGAFACALGLVQVLGSVVHFGALRHWTSLSALGMALILGAAFMERHSDSIARYTRLLRVRLEHW